VICVSAVKRALVERHFGSRARTAVVPNGVEIEELCAARPFDKPAGRRIVLTVGRLEAYKQVDHLVTALRALPEHVELVVIGDGEARPELEALATRLGVGERLHLLGRVSQADLLAWYHTADIFVSLSLHEAFGITLLEAAVGGAAVVASDIPAHREVASFVPRDRVTFVDPHCGPEELARLVEDVLPLERPASVADWPLPTWERTVNGALAGYGAVLNARWSAVSREGSA